MNKPLVSVIIAVKNGERYLTTTEDIEWYARANDMRIFLWP